MPLFTWRTDKKTETYTVAEGIRLMDALHDAGVPLEFPCGGAHSCGKCQVAVSGALSEPSEEERRLLQGAPSGTRLACFAVILGDCSASFLSHGGERIATDYSIGDAALDPLYTAGCGAAFDIGTTTVAGYLFSRRGKEPLAIMGEMNRQGRYGGDVLSRIHYAMEHTVEPLRSLICQQMSDMLRQMCRNAGIAPEQVSALCVTGNTTMLHLASGLDPHSLSQAPFLPQSLFGEAMDLGLPGFPGLQAYLPRCISAYVGADITCSILTSGILHKSGKYLLVDVGTNGEMVLKTEDQLYCCATAAGPAFEGAGISCGSSARNGAIGKVTLDAQGLHCTVIGGTEASSICGSGLIDAVACLLQAGDIDPKGRIRAGLDGEIPLSGNVKITQKDVRQLQLAKGAIRGGMDTLLDTAGISYGELEQVIFCGGFGSYLTPRSAARIGLLPYEVADRTVAIGNAAGTGASRMLQSRPLIREADEITAMAQLVELSTSLFFQKRYIWAMNFPKE